MNLQYIVILFLALLYKSIVAETCKGGEPKELPDNCEEIDLRPLRITGDADVTIIKQKLESVKTITAGVEVSGTSFTEFDFLPNVETITNDKGPALKFERNLKLNRIKIPKLKRLVGKDEEVLFDHDIFPTNAVKSDEGLGDLISLRNISQNSQDLGEMKDTCREYIKIIINEKKEGSNWTTILAVILFVLGVVVFIVLIYICYYKPKKQKAAVEEAAAAQNGGDKGDKAGNKSRKSAKNVKENSKNK